MGYKEKAVEELLAYGRSHLGLDKRDAVYVRNLLLKELGCDAAYDGEIDKSAIEGLLVPDAILEPLREGLIADGMDGDEAERKTDALMGLISPLPSKVIDEFQKRYAEDPAKATDYLYALSIANDYVKKSRVDKNILFGGKFEKGPSLEISINLSKPEKSNAEIAAARNRVDTGYPKCLLCPENEGYAGRPGHPSRGNLRYIPLELSGKTWYLQYSPYVYYPEHCILFLQEHVPMKVDAFSIDSLLSFVEKFPHYFMGSNSDLPIVGGSILNHEHFQGGAHELPLLRASFKQEFACKDPDVHLHEVDFYDTCLCLVSKDRQKLLKECVKIHEAWKKYDDIGNEIISSDSEGQHSTSTIIAKKVGDEYRLYVILRNNRTSQEHPGGIFHAHKEYSHIKQEGIGLIEAAGLFILPGRLKRQTALVEEAAKKGTSFQTLVKEHPDLEAFKGMFNSLKAGISSKAYIAGVCRLILDNVAVYKKDEKGRKGLERFLSGLGYGI